MWCFLGVYLTCYGVDNTGLVALQRLSSTLSDLRQEERAVKSWGVDAVGGLCFLPVDQELANMVEPVIGSVDCPTRLLLTSRALRASVGFCVGYAVLVRIRTTQLLGSPA